MRIRHVLLSLAAALGLVVLISSFSVANNAGTVSNTFLAQTTVAATDTLANSTTPTTLASGFVIVANQLDRAGKFLDIVFGGTVSDTGTPDLTVAAIDSATVLWSSGATALGSGIANLTWDVSIRVTCVTAGASGLVRVGGRASFGGAAALAPIMGATAIAGTGTIAFDTTVAHTIAARVTWGTASASNTITQGWCYGILGN